MQPSIGWKTLALVLLLSLLGGSVLACTSGPVPDGTLQFQSGCTGVPVSIIATGYDYDQNGACLVYDGVLQLRLDYGDGSSNDIALNPEPFQLRPHCFTFSHTYANPGVYDLTLYVTDNGGTTDLPVLPLEGEHQISTAYSITISGCTIQNPGTATVPAYSSASPFSVTYSAASGYVNGLAHRWLWYRQGLHGQYQSLDLPLNGDAGSYDFTPADGDGTYYFKLSWQDNAATTSPYSAEASTIYETIGAGTSTSGRVFAHNQYLYPGGPLVQTSVYDESGNQVRQATLNYGLAGELLGRSGSTDAVSYRYDSAYRVTSIYDGNGRETQYTYDPAGHLATEKYPDGKLLQYTQYDPAGNVLQRVDPNGVITKYKYLDPEHLLTNIDYSTSFPSKSFKYDTVYGRLTEVHDGWDTTTYGSYDSLDIPSSIAVAYQGMSSSPIGYSFCPNGSLDTLSTPGGAFTYAYDGLGRPTGLSLGDQTFSWTYYDNDWLKTQTTPVSVTNYCYNSRGFLTELTNRALDQSILSDYGATSMTYDALGNLLSLTASVPNVASQFSGTTNYQYDTQNQLTQEQSTRNSSYTQSFAYDGAGNQTTLRGTSGRVFNANNQNKAFGYDSAGNPTTYKGSALTFDPENRMTAYGSALTAGYTTGGLRAWKQGASGKTYFLYAGGVPVCELNSGGTVTAVNIYGPSGLLARNTGSGNLYYTFDPQGNTSQVLNATGQVVSTQLFDAFGSLLLTAGNNATPFGYGAQHGYYTDSETGLQLLTHRYYDPSEGRFLNRDPIGYSGGANLYRYAGNNVVNAADPSGFCSDGGWGHNLYQDLRMGTQIRNAQILSNMGPGTLGWVAAGFHTTLNDMATSLFGILDLGTGSGRVAGGDHSLGAIIGAGGDVLTVVGVGAGIYARVGAEAAEVIEEGSELELQTHHIVEQRNIGRFGKGLIEDVSNTADVEKSFHQQISDFYSSKNEWLTGKGFSTVRQWMNTMDYQQQYEWGTKIMYHLKFGGPLK